MKRYNKQSIEYAKRYTKDWDYFIIATDAYGQGFCDAKQEANLPNLGNDEIEYTSTDGKHQLTATSFLKWKKDNYNLSLKQLFINYLPMIDLKDLRVIEKDGKITFQGEAIRKKP